MSSYVLMRVLESAPERYDRGIRILTLGRIDKNYDDLASYIKSGQNVLDIGCGTGLLTIRAALRGAMVRGIDINPQMLEIATQRVNNAGLSERVELCEKGVAEIDEEPPEKYDAVMCGLCLSELSENELGYALEEIIRILKPNGLLLIADETVPKNILKRILFMFIRIPLIAITYILTQATTRAIANLPDKVKNAGFKIESVRWSKMGNFVEIVAKKVIIC